MSQQKKKISHQSFIFEKPSRVSHSTKNNFEWLTILQYLLMSKRAITIIPDTLEGWELDT